MPAPAVFFEIFAGRGRLSQAVSAHGFETVVDEAAEGGTDFLDALAVDELKRKLESHLDDGRRVALHLAPPCSTFSRARDRGRRTRLRSSKFPGGLPGCKDRVADGNLIALTAYDLARWAAERGALVSIENPRRSYIWEYLESERPGGSHGIDVAFCACMYGAPYRKETLLRCWNWKPKALTKMCVLQDGQFSCGRSQEQGHEVLEFGGHSTALAAEYVEGVCAAWALDLANAVSADTSKGQPLELVRATSQGRVRRHALRGEDAESKKERRRREDLDSQAGMRNPADLVSTWPRLWQTMVPIKKVLEDMWHEHDELRDLAEACGKEPSRQPPSDGVLREVRAKVAAVLGVDESKVEKHHPASPWRFEVVRQVQKLSGDPDVELSSWLEHGAPMGIKCPISFGGLFPEVEPSPLLSLDDLDAIQRCTANHPSFDERHGLDESPGITVVKGYLEAGFGRLFADAAAASEHFGVDVHPAPMGNITKTLADGTLKHRPIQDLRRNRVNDVVVLPERQVLPRPIDHAKDLAQLSGSAGPEDSLATLVLDFKAYMGKPLVTIVTGFFRLRFRSRQVWLTPMVPKGLSITGCLHGDSSRARGTALQLRSGARRSSARPREDRR